MGSILIHAAEVVRQPASPGLAGPVLLMAFVAFVAVAAMAAATGCALYSDNIKGPVARWRALLITAPVAATVTVAVVFGLLTLHAHEQADYDAWPRTETAANPSTPADALSDLATDSRSDVRRYVASNSSTPGDALTLLASDTDTAIRAAVARNPSTPAATLRTLAGDPDAAVSAAARRG